MATTLKNTVSFSSVAPGVAVSAPHHLKTDEDRPLVPDYLDPDPAGVFAITADDVNVTVTNNSALVQDLTVLCESWHTIERNFGAAQTTKLSSQPFVSGAVAVVWPVRQGILKNLVNGVPTPLFTVDMTKTTIPPSLIPDYTWSGKTFFSVECSDGTDRQIRAGDANSMVALKLPATYATAQATSQTSAATGGTLAVAFTWTTLGNIATFNVTATTSLLLPTELIINYFVLYATHPAFVYV